MPTSNNVKNLNTLNPLGFEFTLARTPNLVWFISGVNVPGIAVGDSSLQYSVGKAAIAGDALEYNELSITFVVDESMNGWREIYNWMRGIAPTKLGQEVDGSHNNQFKQLKDSDHGVTSDATLILHTNASNPNIKFEFKDVFPISLSDIEMNIAGTDVESITATVSFRYTRYDITVVSSQESNAVEGNVM